MKKPVAFVIASAVILTAFFCTILPAYGAFLRDVPVTLEQPDGTTISCFASGDEFYNWLHDADNYTIIKNKLTGYYVYATIENNSLTPTGYMVGKTNPKTTGLRPGLNIFPSRVHLKSGAEEDIQRAPSSGDYNNIVIFVRFADQGEFTEGISVYDEMFNGTTSSMAGYFNEISNGKLNIASTWYPTPMNGAIFSYQDKHERSYYELYDSLSNPNGYKEEQLTDREHTLLQNAVESVKLTLEATGINFDSDMDGYVDNICFIVQGNAEGWSNLLWPHKWALYSKEVYISGNRVWEYNFQLSERTDVGVLCHEMFHTIGAPDLYHYDQTGLTSVGGWDLMASSNAQHTTTWMKYRYGNWFNSIPEITGAGSYKLPPVSENPFACYKIRVPESINEFFVVEYRKKTGYDNNLYYSYDEGLLVYRIDSTLTGNRNGPPDEIYVLRPGVNESSLNGYLGDATFSANQSRIVLNSESDPYPHLLDGSSGSLSIYDVGTTGDSIEFKVIFGESSNVTADFTVSDTIILTGEEVLFTDLSEGNPTSWFWDFGDGGTSTEQHPVYAYENEGVYTVQLIVANETAADTITKESYIQVNPSVFCPQHFHTVWEGTSGVDHMNIYCIGAKLNELDLEPGDEVGIFDGELCVGYGKVEQTIDNMHILGMVVSRNDGSGNGYTNGNSISYMIWDCSSSTEWPVQTAIYYDNQLNPVSAPAFESGATAFVELSGRSIVCITASFQEGWNLFSVNSLAEPSDIKTLFQPLIDNGTLIKVQDEQGNSLENLGIFGGWLNNIGIISPTEGYKIKVSSDDSLTVCGMPVEYPFPVTLSAGWNIAGFPQEIEADGMDVIQQMIDRGSLIKVQDEAGKSIENLGIFGGWQNNIGNLVPGGGYKIKVSADDVLWIAEGYPKSKVIMPEAIAVAHFDPVYKGKGIDHMNINLAGLTQNVFSPGDELAVFDGEMCVGSITLMSHHFAAPAVSVAASAADEFGMPGFIEGNKISLKIWSKTLQREFELEPEILAGTPTFLKHESTLLSLEKYSAMGLEGELVANEFEIICFPNPFSEGITIEINLSEDAEVQMEVLNQLGQKVKTIVLKQSLTSGSHHYYWNGKDMNNHQVVSGIYHMRVNVDDKVNHHKVVLFK